MLMVYPWVRGSPDIISETITNQFRQIQLFTDKIGNNRVRLFTIPIKLKITWYQKAVSPSWVREEKTVKMGRKSRIPVFLC